MYQFVIPDEFKPFVFTQIWEAEQDINAYSKKTYHEIKEIEEHLPDKPEIVIDLASGLGRMSIGLCQYREWKDSIYILADRDGRTVYTGSWDPKNDEYYNDLNLAREFCRINGIKHVSTFDTEKDRWNTLPPANFLISVAGVGYHIPIGRYSYYVRNVLAPGATAIFDLHTRAYPDLDSVWQENENLLRQFQTSELIRGKMLDGQYYAKNWLVLKGFADGN